MRLPYAVRGLTLGVALRVAGADRRSGFASSWVLGGMPPVQGIRIVSASERTGLSTPRMAWRDTLGTAKTRGEVLKLLLKLGLSWVVLNKLSCLFSTGGTDGGTRTHTEIALQRILSPLRLPFRHTGIPLP